MQAAIPLNRSSPGAQRGSRPRIFWADHLGMRWLIVLFLALLLLPAAAPTLSAQVTADDGFTGRMARYEKFLSEGNYESALDGYQQLAKMDLAEPWREWVNYRLADIPLQRELTRPRATTVEMLTPLREAVSALLTPRVTHGQLSPEVTASVRESLGDSYWLLPKVATRPGVAVRDLTLAWPHYRAALDFWAASTEIGKARERYVAIMLKVLRPIRRAEPSEDLLALIPPDYVRRAESIAEHQEHRVTLKLALALGEFPTLEPADHGEVKKLLEDALSLAQGTPLLDEVLWQTAQFHERFGKVRETATDALSRDALFQPDLPAAMALYKRLEELAKTADSSLPEAAIRRMAELTAPSLALRPSAQFLPGSQASFLLATQNLAGVELSLYRVDLAQAVDLAKPAGPAASNRAPVLADPAFSSVIKPAWSQEMRSWSEDGLDLGNFEPTERLIEYQGVLEPGAYLLEGRAKGLSARTVVLVGGLRASVLKSGPEALVWVVQPTSGQTVEGAEVALWLRAGKAWSVQRASTGSDGIARFSKDALVGADELLALIRKDASQTFATWLPDPEPQSAQMPPMEAFSVSEPGASTLRWMLLAPGFAAESTTPADRKPSHYQLRQGESVIAHGALEINECGVTRGQAPLPADLPANAPLELALFQDLKSREPLAILPVRARAGGASAPAGGTVLLKILGQQAPGLAGERPVHRLDNPLTIKVLATNPEAFPVPRLPLAISARTLGGSIIWESHAITNAEGLANITLPPGEIRTAGGGLVHLRIMAAPEEAGISSGNDSPVPGDEVETLLAFTTGQPLLKLEMAQRLVAPGAEVSASLRAVNPWGQPAEFTGTARLLRLTRAEVWSNPLLPQLTPEMLAKARAELPSFPPPPAAGGRLDWTREPMPTVETEVATREAHVDPAMDGGLAEIRFTPAEPGLYAIAVSPAGEAEAGAEPLRVLFIAAGPEQTDLGWFRAGAQPALWLERQAPAAEGQPAAWRGLAFGEGSGNPLLLALSRNGLPEVRVLKPKGRQTWFEMAEGASPEPATLILESLAGSTTRTYEAPLATAPVAVTAADPSGLPLELLPGQLRPGAPGRLRIGSANPLPQRLLAWLEPADRISLAAAQWHGRRIAGFASIPERQSAGLPPIVAETDLGAGELPLVYGVHGGLLRKSRDYWEAWNSGWNDLWKAEPEHAGRWIAQRLDPLEAVLRQSAGHGSPGADPIWLSSAFPGSAAEGARAPSPVQASFPVPGRRARILADDLEMATPAAPGNAEPGVSAAPPPLPTPLDVGFRWPEAPGNWRIAVLSVDRLGITRYSELERTIQQPLEFALNAPAFLRAGDSVLVEVPLENYEEAAREVTVTLSATGGTLTPSNGAGEAPVRLEAGERRVLAWSLSPGPDSTGIDLKLEITGSDEFSAGREHHISIRAARSAPPLRAVGRYIAPAPAEGDAPPALELPLNWEGSVPGQAAPPWKRLRLSAYAGFTPVSVTAARDLLLAAREPASLEELASGILPAARLAASEELQKVAGSREALELILSGQSPPALVTPPLPGQPTLLADRVRTALDVLAACQLPDGGWAWSPGGNTADPFTSAHLLWSLALLREAGWNPRPDLLAKGAAYLEATLAAAPSNGGLDEDALALHAWMLNALTAAVMDSADLPPKPSNPVKAAVNLLWSRRADLSSSGLALQALSLRRLPKGSERNNLPEVLAALEKAQIRSEMRGSPGDAEGPVLRRWGLEEGWSRRQDCAVDSTALALLALEGSTGGELPALREGAAHWLAERLLNSEQYALDARARALAGLALSSGSRLDSPSSAPDQQLTPTAGSQTLETRGLPSGAQALLPLAWTLEGTPLADLSAEREGALPAVRVKITSGQPQAAAPVIRLTAELISAANPAVPPPEDSLSQPLQRQFFHTVSRPTLFEGRVLRKEPVMPGSPIIRGEEVELAVDLSAPRRGLRYAQLRLPLPAGLVLAGASGEAPITLYPGPGHSPVLPGAGPPVHMWMEARDHVLVLTAREIPGGDWRILLPMRAPFPGRYDLPPAELREVYQPVRPAYTPANTLEIIANPPGDAVEPPAPAPPETARGDEPGGKGPG